MKSEREKASETPRKYVKEAEDIDETQTKSFPKNKLQHYIPK